MTPKVFISYSHANPLYKDWVLNLAKRLVSNGVDVSIDVWDLKEGNDLFHYMETMVKSDEIIKVLIVSDSSYAKKSDTRKGGVGTETQIISPKIYQDVSQEKFIPIIIEKDEDGNPFLPIFLKSRLYIDMSEFERFEENYAILLRNIFNRPSYAKPKLGNPPEHLFDETLNTYETNVILLNFDNQINKDHKRINSMIKEFLEAFLKNLKEFTIDFQIRDPIEVGKLICENIIQYTPLRDDFIKFFDKVIRSEIDFNIDL